MATAAEILELREYIREPNDETYTDEILEQFIAAKGVRGAAQTIWQGKAAGVAHLVDISEGGSTRKTSDLYKNYLAIAATFAEPTAEEAAASTGTIVRQIERV